MCVKPNLGDKVVPVRCQPKTYPCPTCGRRGHRKRRLDRYVRSLDYGRALWLHVFYAEYTARCNCRKYLTLRSYATPKNPPRLANPGTGWALPEELMLYRARP
jgi:hypothetical protein